LTSLLLVVIIPCTFMLPTFFILEMLYIGMEIQHWCMYLGNIICVAILWLRKDHIQGARLTGSVIRLAWYLSSWEISLKLNFVFYLFFLFLFTSLHCNTTKKKLLFTKFYFVKMSIVEIILKKKTQFYNDLKNVFF